MTGGRLLGLRRDRIMVEFTRHTGDEMYRHGRGWAAEWRADKATRSAEGPGIGVTLDPDKLRHYARR